jgi:hypothetical protein
MDMTPPTDNELEACPHVMIKSDLPWDPQHLDDLFKATDIVLVQEDDINAACHCDSLNDSEELIL